MRVAILGGSSLIARDLVESFAAKYDWDCDLYSRQMASVANWLDERSLLEKFNSKEYHQFSHQHRYDVVLNCVGVGSPIKAKEIGALILDSTIEFDSLAIEYIKKVPNCKYIFLSSGAAYGGNFESPVNEKSYSSWSINSYAPNDFYGLAKMYAECRHRALKDLPIVDLRIFNYFSHSQSLMDGFLITDALSAVIEDRVLKTSNDNIIRDYIGPTDFAALVSAVLLSDQKNDVLDCYTKAPIDKFSLLHELSNQFKLQYEIIEKEVGVNATGVKKNYYSINKRAEKFGFFPALTSLETVVNEARRIMP